MKFDTKIVRAGIESDPTTGAIVPPIYQTATYVLPEVGRDLGFDYTRSANPTRQMLEEQLAAIEGGKYGVCFASGMATVDSCMKLLKAGDHVVCSDDVYGGVSRHFNRILVNYDLHFTYVDSSNPRKVKDAVCPETKMLWVETPTNPLLKVTDLVAMAQIAKEHDLLYGVDSTFATPVFLRPLEFGADMVVHSTTKYLSGHNQLIGGVGHHKPGRYLRGDEVRPEDYRRRAESFRLLAHLPRGQDASPQDGTAHRQWTDRG